MNLNLAVELRNRVVRTAWCSAEPVRGGGAGSVPAPDQGPVTMICVSIDPRPVDKRGGERGGRWGKARGGAPRCVRSRGSSAVLDSVAPSVTGARNLRPLLARMCWYG